jgi:hypothetical protein
MKLADLSIDPGQEMALALWPHRMPKLRPPISILMITPRKGSSWAGRVDSVMGAFVESLALYMKMYRIKRAFCEWPGYFDDQAGQLTASTGALVKLTYAVGRTAQALRERGIEFVPINVADWKGQTSKEIVERRIRRRLGDAACAEFEKHMWDAVGLGMVAKGYPLSS